MRTFRRRIVLIAYSFLLLFVYEILFPLGAYALTGGPSQPEVQSFEPIGTSDMVDAFTGDFKYNIPLLEIDGYPINMSYSAGIGTDQEASWVGLGWNLNVGSIDRNVRGLPDDFDGDNVEVQENMRDNWTLGVRAGNEWEIFGKVKQKAGQTGGEGSSDKKKILTLSQQFGIVYNNYSGFSYETSFGIDVPKIGTDMLTAGLNFNYNVNDGLDISGGPEFNFGYKLSKTKMKHEGQGAISVGAQYNSRMGMRALNYGWGMKTAYQNKKKENRSVRNGGNSAITFGYESYTPSVSTPMSNFSIDLTFKVGKEIKGFTKNTTFNATYSRQKITDPKRTLKAFGFNKMQNAGEDDMIDINRTNDGPVSANRVFLPVIAQTFDMYSVSGHGIGGSFRPFRNDIFNYHDQSFRSNNNNISTGFELAGLDKFKWGGNINYTYINSESGNWSDEKNDLQNKVKRIRQNEISNPAYEPVYIRSQGEPTRASHVMNPHLSGTSILAPYSYLGALSGGYFVNTQASDIGTPKTYHVYSGSATDHVQLERQPRNTVFIPVNYKSAFHSGLNRKPLIEYFSINQQPDTSLKSLKPAQTVRIKDETSQRKEHHIGEVNVVNPQGSRYVYGIAAYNESKTEVTYAIANGSSFNTACTDGLVNISSGSDLNADENNKGQDHYVNKTITPGYAYSYLLTGILSPDYQDLTENGITNDDPGTAIRFNYTLANASYGWRIPYGYNKANYLEGKKSDALDDKASIIYGRKELWYVHSVEGKNHIAQFYISERLDAYGVEDIYGSPEYSRNGHQYKLDSIVLYNKEDFLAHGKNAYKVKAVHFTYDYDLCGNVPNFKPGSSHAYKGKLTLKSIFFTYGTSYRSKFSPYKFEYNNERDNNFLYHLKAQDRWGSYLPANANNCNNTTTLSSSEFPYTPIDEADANEYAGAWALSRILLPSGGKIDVDYEADDYGYVQDLKAMSMYKIAGFGETSDVSGSQSLLYTTNPARNYNYVFIDLGEATTNAEVQEMFSGMTELQFNVYADINGKGRNYEFVKGYASIDSENYGITSNSSIAYVGLKAVTTRDKGGRQANPISFAIWNFARLTTPEIVYNQKMAGGGNSLKENILAPAKHLVGLYNEIVNTTAGINNNLRTRGFGKTVELAKSFVRINAKNRTKNGGGHRVKSIKINDHWAYIGSRNNGASDFEYGQEYDYTLEETFSDGSRKTITSGVASYEPAIGGDENPYHRPMFVHQEYKLVSDPFYMIDVPPMEAYMPAPSVGYRRVTVKNLSHQGVSRTATGRQVFEFYTAREFPSLTSNTELTFRIRKPNKFAGLVPGWNNYMKTHVTASQGYKIELNDMHGKAKAEYTYAEGSEQPIGGVEYYYKQNPDVPKMLSNTVKLAKPDGTLVDQEIGVETEVFNDFRTSKNQTHKVSVSLNTDFFTLFSWPLLIPTFFNAYKRNDSEINTAVTIKVVQRYGILQKTVAIKEGSRIESENLVYDYQTGDVLITSVQNEFNDKTYNTTYPAHWAYEGMGQAYKNVGLIIHGVTCDIDSIYLPGGLNPRDIFYPGDEVLATGAITPHMLYVYEGPKKRLNFILEHNGGAYSNTLQPFTIEIMRSGRRNLAGTPIQQVNTKRNPINSTSLLLDSVITASAVEFQEYWPFYCAKETRTICDTVFRVNEADFINFVNTLADTVSFTGGSHYIDLNCALRKLDAYGYSFIDSALYRRVVVSETASYEPITEYDCFSCLDKVYVQLDSNRYTPFNTSFFSNCLNNSEACCVLNTNLAQYVDHLPFYTTLNNQLNVLRDTSPCPPGDTMLFVNNQNCSNGSLNNGLRLSFSKCGISCAMDFELPDNFCYKRFLGLHEITEISSASLRARAIFELPDSSFDTLEISISSNCFYFVDLDCRTECYTPVSTTVLNPYQMGILGNWRMSRNYTYVDQRKYNNQPSPRHDGIFNSFSSFYSYHAPSQKYTANAGSNWVWATRITKYSPAGNEIENKDTLGRYSAAVFGLNQTLPVAVAGNAMYEQIAYEGFEENSQFGQTYGCPNVHFQILPGNSTEGEISKEYAHTGKYSLRVNLDEQVSLATSLSSCSTSTPQTDSTQYVWDNCNCVGKFNPKTGKYIFSAWLKQGNDMLDTSYLDAGVEIKLHTSSGSSTVLLKADGPIVEGWQRVYGEFEIASNVISVDITLISSTEVDTWFDDIRIHPFNGNMKTYAYDQITLRLLAELDDNNFATIYEYDEEGALVRVKKETIQGIKTLKEVRKQILKQP